MVNLCNDCSKFISQTNTNCDIFCDEIQLVENKEYSNIITIDYDGLHKSVRKLLELCNLKDNKIISKKFRLSSSKLGTHVKIELDKSLTFDERINIRRILDDCHSRVELDINDKRNFRDTDVLYDQKENRKVTNWEDINIDNINKLINLEPFWK